MTLPDLLAAVREFPDLVLMPRRPAEATLGYVAERSTFEYIWPTAEGEVSVPVEIPPGAMADLWDEAVRVMEVKD